MFQTDLSKQFVNNNYIILRVKGIISSKTDNDIPTQTYDDVIKTSSVECGNKVTL